jgi:UDP-N-acetylmuramate--alanine ligase
MHIFFSGIGGTGIGPLSLISHQAGFAVSGSDKQDSGYIHYLEGKGITDIHIGQSYEQIAEVHAGAPIDWYVYSSAVTKEQGDLPDEIRFCQEHGIKATRRDELLNEFLRQKNLKMVAIAGTHGKTTTTAMAVWLFQQLGIPESHSVAAKMSFAEMGQYTPGSEYFIYEADEYDKNFLAFHPHISIITGIDWDHPDVFPTRESYNGAHHSEQVHRPQPSAAAPAGKSEPRERAAGRHGRGAAHRHPARRAARAPGPLPWRRPAF